MGIFIADTADFEMVNGQPVPIEQDFTSISTDDDAQQNDQTAGALDTQPADITCSNDSAPDHNGGENCDLTQDENLSQVREQESTFVALNPTVENMEDSIQESCHDVSFQGENMEGLYDLEDMTLQSPEYCRAMLCLINVEQPILEDILYGRSNVAKARSIIKVMYSVVRFKQYLRRDHLANNPFF